MEQKNSIPGYSWQINPDDTRARVGQFFKKAVIPFVFIAFIAATIGYPLLFTKRLLQGDFKDIVENIFWMVGVGGVGVFLLFFLVNKFFPYAKRRYQITETGISIAKNNKKKEYSWKEFESFSLYQPLAKQIKSPRRTHPGFIGEDLREKLMKTEKNVMGSLFYLKKKRKGIISMLSKHFVVIYTTPENSETVTGFLSLKLLEKAWKVGGDSGLTFYEFK